jgi:hypothetical protein
MRYKTIFMETTKISPSITVGEIQKILGEYGASAIRMDYEDGEVSSVSFTYKIDEGEPIAFRLPCRWQAIKNILELRRKKSRRGRPPGDITAQAKRIAWRHIMRLVEAQMAFIATGQSKIPELMLGFLLTDREQTLFEKFESQNWKFQIEHKKKKED